MLVPDVVGAVGQIQECFEEICRSELGRYLRKTGTHDAKAMLELQDMVSRIAAEVAHPLVTHLRIACQDPRYREVCEILIHRVCKIKDAALA